MAPGVTELDLLKFKGCEGSVAIYTLARTFDIDESPIAFEAVTTKEYA